MKYEIEIECIPDGYEPVRFGVPADDEEFMNCGLIQVASRHYPCQAYLVLRKVKRWRQPVLPDDAGKVCRYSDDNENWSMGCRLHGWDRSDLPWIIHTGSRYKYCEVEE